MRYAESLARLDAARAREAEQGVHAHSRTAVLTHGVARERVVLFLHGLTSTPAQFVELASLVHERGCNAVVPLMPRHGLPDRMTGALAGLTRAELLAAAQDAVAVARGLGNRLTVAGISMGGTLAAWLGQRRREIDHALLIEPFFGIAALPRGAGAPFSRVLATLPNVFRWWDPELRERCEPQHAYPRFATRALAAVLSIAAETMRAARSAPPAAQRLTLAVNARDPSCNNSEIRYLAALWERAAPERTVVVEWRDLPPIHDIVEPSASASCAVQTYPRLLALIDQRLSR